MSREMKHPTVEVEENAEGFLIRFFVPGSKFGAIEVILDTPELDDLIMSLDQAVVFAGNP